MRRFDLKGIKKGRLTVVSFSKIHIQPSGQKRAIWNVICECGKYKEISASCLLHSKVVSCGCYINELRKKGMRKRDKDSDIRQFITHYKASAKVRSKVYDLTFGQFKELVTSNCYFCNEIPQNRYTKIGNLRKVRYNGIDRLNNDIGYIHNNCVPCCGLCNRMKGESSEKEFIKKITEIYKKHVKKIKK